MRKRKNEGKKTQMEQGNKNQGKVKREGINNKRKRKNERKKKQTEQGKKIRIKRKEKEETIKEKGKMNQTMTLAPIAKQRKAKAAVRKAFHHPAAPTQIRKNGRKRPANLKKKSKRCRDKKKN